MERSLTAAHRIHQQGSQSRDAQSENSQILHGNFVSLTLNTRFATCTDTTAQEVTSLASHLACVAQELCSFWGSIDDGSDGIRALGKDLEILGCVLEHIRIEAQFYEKELLHTTLQGLNVAHCRLKELHSIVSQLEASFLSRSHQVRGNWPSMKWAIIDDKMESFQKALGDTKVTLLLACQISQARTNLRELQLIQCQRSFCSNRSTQQHSSPVSNTAFSSSASAGSHRSICVEGFEVLCLGLLEIMRGLAANPHLRETLKFMQGQNAQEEFILCDEQNHSSESTSRSSAPTRQQFVDISHKPPRKRSDKTGRHLELLSLLFGTIRISRKTQLKIDYCASDTRIVSSETSLLLHASCWLLKIGFRFGSSLVLARAKRGWKVLLEPFRAVPDNALIFELSQAGNVQAVEILIRRAEASIWDIDSLGRTPLHYSAYNHKPEMCKAFFDWGISVDIAADAFYYIHPYVIVARSPTTFWNWTPNGQELICTLRAFLRYLDTIILHDDPRDYQFLKTLMPLFPKGWSQSSMEPFLWYLTYLIPYRLHLQWTKNLEDLYTLLSHSISHLQLTKALMKFLCGPPKLCEFTECDTLGVCAYRLKELRFSAEIPRILIRSGFRMSNDFFSRPPTGCFAMALPSNRYTTFLCAMSTSLSFSRWRELLREFQCSIEDVAQHETKNGMPLADQGWTAASILELLTYEFEPVEDVTDLVSDPPYSSHFTIELWWSVNIERFRRGLTPLPQPLNSVEFILHEEGPDYVGSFWYYGSKYIDGFDRIDEVCTSRCPPRSTALIQDFERPKLPPYSFCVEKNSNNAKDCHQSFQESLSKGLEADNKADAPKSPAYIPENEDKDPLRVSALLRGLLSLDDEITELANTRHTTCQYLFAGYFIFFFGFMMIMCWKW